MVFGQNAKSKTMENLAQFSALVEAIYDASVDAALWPNALEQICAFVRGCGAAIYYNGASISFFTSWGYEPHFLQSFQETYSKINPFLPSALFLEIGKVYSANDIIPMDEFRGTRLYKEWARPQGLLDALQTNLERTATGASTVAVHGHERDGLFDAAAKSRFALLVPHVQRAISISKVIEFNHAKEAALADTLDTLENAVVLVARDSRIVYVNEAGNTLLTRGHILRALQGRLAATDAGVDTELQAAIAAAARGDDGLGVQGIAIPLAAMDLSSPVAHVLSLSSRRRRDLLPGQSVAAVFVRSMTSAVPAPIEILAKRYGLTAAEVRVLASLAASSSVADMAQILGIGEATVKSHLQRLFTKTGVRRQIDLLKLLTSS